MKTLVKQNSNKRVNIKESSNGVAAFYVQMNATGISVEEQVLESKFFASVKNAEKWAAKMLAA